MSMEAQVIELRADDAKARPALDRINESLSTIEQRARQMAQRAKQAFDDFTAATARALRSAGTAVKNFAEQHQALANEVLVVAGAFAKQHIAMQQATVAYQLARLALSPYTYSLVLAAKAMTVLTIQHGNLIREQARGAAQAKLTAREYQILANTAALTGVKTDTMLSAVSAVRTRSAEFEEFGIQTSFGPYGTRSEIDILGEAQARLSQIRNPFERERQRQALGLPSELRSDFRGSVEASRLFGAISTEEGVVAIERIRTGAQEIKEGFLDAGRAVKLFAGSLVRDTAEGLAIVLTRTRDLFREFREQSASDPRGRSGVSGARRTEVPGIRAILGIQDQIDTRGPLAALYPGAPGESELRDQLRIGQMQIKQIEEQQRRAQEEAIRAEARALDILAQARAKDGGELAQIRQKYAQYRDEIGKTTTAVNALREAERLEVAALVQAARDRVMSDSRKAAADQVERGIPDVGSGARLRSFERNQAFQVELLGLQQQADLLALSPNGEAEARRASALTRLDSQELLARSVQQKVAIEQQKLAVEQQFIRETSQLRADAIRRDYEFELAALQVQYEAKLISEEQFQQKREVLSRIQELNQDRLGGQTQQQLDAAREQSIQRQTQLYIQQASAIQSSFERTIDALFSRTQSLGQAVMSILQAAFLTPLKQFSASFLTSLFMGGGQQQQAASGGFGTPGFAGGGGGLGALFGGMMMSGGQGGGMMMPGGFGSIFTGGFAGGPGAAGIGAGGGAGRFGGFSGYGKNFMAQLRQLGSIGFGPKGGDFGGEVAGSYRGIGGAKGGALLMGGGLLAFDGLRRGGMVGLAQTTAGGAMIGAKFGGGLGAAIGAGIGFAAGFIRLFIKGAEEKAIQKVKDVYGVNINRDLAKTIVEQAKAMGGLDIAITAPQIREMIELYAMATGQRIGPGNSVRPVSLVQSNGVLYQQSQMVNQQPFVFRSALPTFGGGSGATVIQVQLSPTGTQSFLEGQTVSVIGSQRVGAQQAIAAPLEYARTAYAG